MNDHVEVPGEDDEERKESRGGDQKSKRQNGALKPKGKAAADLEGLVDRYAERTPVWWTNPTPR